MVVVARDSFGRPYDHDEALSTCSPSQSDRETRTRANGFGPGSINDRHISLSREDKQKGPLISSASLDGEPFRVGV